MADTQPMATLISGASTLGLSLGTREADMFSRYSELLLHWNRRINLTNITDPEEIQRKHFLDSLTCLQALETGDGLAQTEGWAGMRFIDVGTGAGFPGLPLKIILPEIQLALLEATGKKTAFLQSVISELGLRDVQVISGRAEEVAHRAEHRHSYDVALARALAPMATLVELTLPFLHPGGMLVAQKGEDPTAEIAEAGYAIDVLGGKMQRVIPITVPGVEAARHLVQIEKVSLTPDLYPRRSGMPKKRPLTRP